MKRTMVVIVCICSLLAVGCRDKDPTVYYGLYDGYEAILAFEKEDTLFVVVLPWSLLERDQEQSAEQMLQQLSGMESDHVINGTGESLQALRSLLTTLVVDTTNMPYDQVDIQARIEALKQGASYLRKTGLADTLSTVFPDLDVLAVLQRVEQVSAYDLRGPWDETTLVDWQQLKSHMQLYLGQIQRLQR